MDRMIKRAGLTSQISHGEFLQAQFLVHLIRAALQKAILIYSMDEWKDDSWDFHFVINGKLPLKKASGEKYLDDMLVPVLGSQQGATLGLLDTWKDDPVHPFVEKYSRERGRVRGVEVEGVTDLKAIFNDGLRFDRRTSTPGCSWSTRSPTPSGVPCCRPITLRSSARTTSCVRSSSTRTAARSRSIDFVAADRRTERSSATGRSTESPAGR